MTIKLIFAFFEFQLARTSLMPFLAEAFIVPATLSTRKVGSHALVGTSNALWAID